MVDMRDKDKLLELICNGAADICGKNCSMPRNQFCAYCLSIANYLLSNGVMVPPCRIGDTVYCIEFAEDIGIDKGKVYAISCSDTEWFSVRYESGLRYDHPKRAFNKTVFLSYEEAEKALKEREGNG